MSVASDVSASSASRGEANGVNWRQVFLGVGRRVSKFLDIIGFGWLVTLTHVVIGKDRRQNAKTLWKQLGVPLVAIGLFLAIWAGLAPKVHTSLGGLPGPQQVAQQAANLWADHLAERAKQRAFLERQDKRNAEIRAADPKAQVKIRPYTGKPTFLDQIATSLETVFTGFLFASLVA